MRWLVLLACVCAADMWTIHEAQLTSSRTDLRRIRIHFPSCLLLESEKLCSGRQVTTSQPIVWDEMLYFHAIHGHFCTFNIKKTAGFLWCCLDRATWCSGTGKWTTRVANPLMPVDAEWDTDIPMVGSLQLWLYVCYYPSFSSNVSNIDYVLLVLCVQVFRMDLSCMHAYLTHFHLIPVYNAVLCMLLMSMNCWQNYLHIHILLKIFRECFENLQEPVAELASTVESSVTSQLIQAKRNLIQSPAQWKHLAVQLSELLLPSILLACRPSRHYHGHFCCMVTVQQLSQCSCPSV